MNENESKDLQFGKNENSYNKKYSKFNKDLNLTKDHIIQALKTVFDPEIPVNIYDLGLIYSIDISEDYDVKINMTLTTPNCPVAEEMPSMVSNAVEKLEGFKSIIISLVWDPPWDQDMMSEDAKLALDIG